MKTESFNAWIDLTGKEIDRKYFYPNGQIIEAKSVKAVQIQPDGTHVVKLTNELEVNVEAGWVAFSFTSPNNDFAFNIANHDQDTLSTWMCLQGKENTRVYTFNGFKYTIENPVKVFIKKSGSHKIVDSKGVCHYIDKSFDNILRT